MPSKPAKLGYMQKRELNDLPKKIDTLESRQKELFEAMSDPSKPCTQYIYKKEAPRKAPPSLLTQVGLTEAKPLHKEYVI